MNDLKDLLQAEPQAETPEPEAKAEDTRGLAELLAAEEEAEVSETEGEAGESQVDAKPTSLKALAEKLKLEDKDLYDIEVPMANGESQKLGQLKDFFANAGDLELREMQFEEAKAEAESNLIRTQQEIKELLAEIPKEHLKPETLEKFRAKRQAQFEEARRETLELIPEWKDEATRTKDITGIIQHLTAYGFPTNYLDSIGDSKTFKYIRDNYLREQRVKRALEKVKKGQPEKVSTSKPAQAPRKAGAQVNPKSRNPLADLLS